MSRVIFSIKKAPARPSFDSTLIASAPVETPVEKASIPAAEVVVEVEDALEAFMQGNSAIVDIEDAKIRTAAATAAESGVVEDDNEAEDEGAGYDSEGYPILYDDANVDEEDGDSKKETKGEGRDLVLPSVDHSKTLYESFHRYFYSPLLHPLRVAAEAVAASAAASSPSNLTDFAATTRALRQTLGIKIEGGSPSTSSASSAFLLSILRHTTGSSKEGLRGADLHPASLAPIERWEDAQLDGFMMPIVPLHITSSSSSSSSSSSVPTSASMSSAATTTVTMTMTNPLTLLHTLDACGFKAPTPIQRQAIPVLLAGHDCIGISQTGSGKTLAYTIPLAVHCTAASARRGGGALGLILAPTRELASQIATQVGRICGPLGLSHHLLTGGSSTWEQTKALRQRGGGDILIATPGRLIDHLKGKSTHLRNISFLVLDEADKMLEMGFTDQVFAILATVRPDRQTVLFSATFPRRVEVLAEAAMSRPLPSPPPSASAGGAGSSGSTASSLTTFTSPIPTSPSSCPSHFSAVKIIVGSVGLAPPEVEQQFIILHSHAEKWAWLASSLCRLLATEGDKMIVFAASRETCEELSEKLSKTSFAAAASLAFNSSSSSSSSSNSSSSSTTTGTGGRSPSFCRALHGEKGQEERDSIVREFRRSNHFKILVATDVASRGLDLKGVSVVVNYDCARNIETHIHRIGRTGRMTKEGSIAPGLAVTLLLSRGHAAIASAIAKNYELSGKEPPPELLSLFRSSSNSGVIGIKGAANTAAPFRGAGNTAAPLKGFQRASLPALPIPVGSAETKSSSSSGKAPSASDPDLESFLAEIDALEVPKDSAEQTTSVSEQTGSGGGPTKRSRWEDLPPGAGLEAAASDPAASASVESKPKKSRWGPDVPPTTALPLSAPAPSGTSSLSAGRYYLPGMRY